MEHYTITENLYFQAWSWRKSGRWGHKAKAVYNGREIAEVNITYLNRTWEAYEFQSVMQKLIEVLDAEKTVPLKDRIQAYKIVKTGDRRDLKKLQSIGAMAMLGGIIGGNKTKARILGSIPGVMIPDDFENLPEIEQSRRLDGAINILTK